MIDEFMFKFVFLGMLASFFIIRIYFQNKYIIESPTDDYPRYIKIMMIASITLMILAPLVYIFTPFLDSLTLNIPVEFRILGIFSLIFVDLAMLWVFSYLKHNFNPNVENRYVVKKGPYNIVRHPMYTVFIVQAFAQTLLSSNLLIFLSIPTIIILKVMRVKFEDRVLIKEFKEEYEQYKREKKALIPGIW